MAKQIPGEPLEKVLLRNDNGTEIYFRGYQYSYSPYFDEERGILTILRLYATDNGEFVYSFVSSSGTEKKRRHYIVAPEGDFYRISDGVQTMRLPLELLFAAVFGLCGIDPERADDLRPIFEENLRMMAG